jgi:hypothetical protein
MAKSRALGPERMLVWADWLLQIIFADATGAILIRPATNNRTGNTRKTHRKTHHTSLASHVTKALRRLSRPFGRGQTLNHPGPPGVASGGLPRQRRDQPLSQRCLQQHSRKRRHQVRYLQPHPVVWSRRHGSPRQNAASSPLPAQLHLDPNIPAGGIRPQGRAHPVSPAPPRGSSERTPRPTAARTSARRRGRHVRRSLPAGRNSCGRSAPPAPGAP